METIICTIITSISGLMVAYLQIQVKKQKEAAEEERQTALKREKRRVKEMMLSLKLNAAVLKLSVVSANALTNGHNNGNVEIARREAVDAENAYMDFMKELMSEELA